MRRGLLLVLSLLAALPAAGEEAPPDGLAWDGAVPRLRLAGGDFTLEPALRLDADLGSFFGQDRPGGFRSGVNVRRGRLGAEGTAFRDVSFRFIWEFGGQNPNDYSNFYEAEIAYTGLAGTAFRAGVLTPQHLPEFAGSSFDLAFMERATITSVVGSLASGNSREAVGIEANGPLGSGRWNASAYGTAGVGATRNDGRRRGAVGRAVVLLPDLSGVRIQIGLDGAAQFRPGTAADPGTVSLDDYPELRVDSRRFLDSGIVPAGRAWAAGPEAAGRVGPLYLEAVWQRVGVDADAGPARHFEGWYVQGLIPLRGPPRERSDRTGTWKRPEAADPYGSLEAGLRYGTTDLGVARQSILTVGLNWFVTDRLRLQAQYENGRTGESRDFQAVGLRASFNL